MKQAFYYKAFGLTIASNIEFCELTKAPSTTGEADVWIQGTTGIPSTIAHDKEAQFGPVTYQVKKGGEVLMVHPKVGKYLIKNDAEIWVEKEEETALHTFRHMTIIVALTMLLQYRGQMMIHGSALSIGNKAVIVTGYSGAGKSTTAALCVAAGAKAITDDICAVRFIEGIPYVLPSFPQLKLWKESMEHLNKSIASAERLVSTLDKFIITDQEYFSQKPIPLKVIVALSKGGDVPAISPPLAGSDHLLALLQNTYKPERIQLLDKFAAQMEFCVQLAPLISFYQLSRPSTGFWKEEIQELVFSLVK